ncbi:MAG: DMT family transporter, partial [Ruminiclostridium sp.]|nr:DMT family transporter [Ruminiclostridium sp.]
CSLVCALWGGGLPRVTGGQGLGFLWLGVFINAIGYLLWALALQDSNAATISNFAYGTPAIAMILSCIFLGEPMYLTSVIGLALILIGFFLQMYLTKRNP